MDNKQQKTDNSSNSLKQFQPNKKRNAFLVILVAVTIVLISLLTFIYMNSQDDDSQSNHTTRVDDRDGSEKKEISELQPEQVTQKIKDTFATKYTLLDVNKNNSPKEGEMGIGVDKGSPVYKAEGFDFYTDYNGGSRITALPGPSSDMLPRPVDVANRTDIAKVYTDFGLSLKETRGVIENGSGVDVYVNESLICTVTSPSSSTTSSSAECGLIKNYKQAAINTKPFADIIPNKDNSRVLFGLTIKDSQASGYQKASVNVTNIQGQGGVSALFYRHTSGNWVYFVNSQQGLPCSLYNTEDLKNAFKGDECYDGSVLSTV